MNKSGPAISNGWRFSSEAYPDSLRVGAWREAVGRLGLTVSSGELDVGFHGTVTSQSSPLGVMFAQIASGAQQFVRTPARGDESILLLQHLDGDAQLNDGERILRLAGGDLVIVSGTGGFTLDLASPFRQIVVRVPRVAVNARMLALNAAKVVHIPGRKGLGFVFSQLLASVAQTIDTLETDDMRPVDLALSEFLVACLAEDPADAERIGATGIQAAVLHRICQKLESQLADPDLSLTQVAREEDLSPRYLQKLFQASGESFTNYLRHRRLERCRFDLESPQLSHLSISDIGFRWGFNDAGHFSRAFRDQFNVSPREFRHDAAQKLSESVLHHVNRGWPHKAFAQKRQRVALFPDAEQKSKGASLDALFDKSKSSQQHHTLAANDKTVHWGYFSRALPPVLEIASGDIVNVEAVTQHANDDHARMIAGDSGLESIYHWTPTSKNVDRRGAGPMDASIYGRGAGEGFGVHIMTGPIAITDARPGDVLEVRILDVLPRPSANPDFAGCCFGSNAATWWGFHYDDLLTEPKPREVVTIYEFDLGLTKPSARAVYNYRWTPQTDPFGVVHPTIDYPGVPVDHATIEKNFNILKGVSIPVRPHFGVIGVAPREAELLDSVPPSYFGGNIDNWRVGKGSTIYLPVSVAGALLSIGDPHASQGDSELCGTAIECSLTGVFQIVLHKRADLAGQVYADLSYPLIETKDEWVLLGFSHPNYLAELGEQAQSDIYDKSSLDLAMKDAFRKMRRFLMATRGMSEDEAISLMSVAVDFGVTQVVDGNWGVHAILRKALFDAE
ncbi:acetamidase/formamidase/AraC-like DNA-binding protein [Nitrobacteraceae bacterium AZCC 2146]